MGIIEDAKKTLDTINTTKNKLTGKTAGKFNRKLWFEIGAYALQAVAVIAPISVITTMNDAWTKTGLGFGVMMGIFALIIIFYRPIKQLNKMAPGLIAFTVIFLFALCMYMTMQTIMIVAGCGIAGSIAAMPLHIAYESSKEEKLTPEAQALLAIAEKLSIQNKID